MSKISKRSRSRDRDRKSSRSKERTYRRESYRHENRSPSPKNKFKLYIRDFPEDLKEHDLRKDLEQYAKILELKLHKRNENQQIYVAIISGTQKDCDKIQEIISQKKSWRVQIERIQSDKRSRSRDKNKEKGNKKKEKSRSRSRKRNRRSTSSSERRGKKRSSHHKHTSSSNNNSNNSTHNSENNNRKENNTKDEKKRAFDRSKSRSQNKNSKSSSNNIGSSSNSGKDKKKDETLNQEVPIVVQPPYKPKSEVRVRELWLGNLPETISEQDLYTRYFIYGEIDKIEIYPHKVDISTSQSQQSYPYYAFLRFKLTSCTSRAAEMKDLEIHGHKIKVQFSDYNKRPEIIGDIPNYDLTYLNCTTLFIAFSVNSQLPSEYKVKEVFQKYGRIRAIFMKQTSPNTQYRPHIFIDYFTHESAQKALEEIGDNDPHGYKKELGDKSVEIMYAIRKRCKDFSNPCLQPKALSNVQTVSQTISSQQIPSPSSNTQNVANSLNLQTQQNQIQNFNQQIIKLQDTNQIIQTLQQSPDFQKIMVHNPQIGTNIINSIYKDPSNAKQIIDEFISSLTRNSQMMQINPVVNPMTQIPTFRSSSQPNQMFRAPTTNPNPPTPSYPQTIQNMNMIRYNQPNQGAIVGNGLQQMNTMGISTTLGGYSTQMQMTGAPYQLSNSMYRPVMAMPQVASQLQHAGGMNPMIGGAMQLIPQSQEQQYIGGNQGGGIYGNNSTNTQYIPTSSVQQVQQQQQVIGLSGIGSVGVNTQVNSLNQPQQYQTIERQASSNGINDILALINKRREQTLEQNQKQQQDEIQKKKLQQESTSVTNTSSQVQPSSAQPSSFLQKSIFDNDDAHVWSGFITRNKQFRVGVDAYSIQGENNEQYLCDHNLNVSHRTTFDDIEKIKIQGVVAFIASDQNQQDLFEGYLQYFESKQRVGIIFLRNGVMFLMPPNEFSKKFFTNERSHMIGIFGDQQAAQIQQAKFNNQQQLQFQQKI